MYFSCLEDSTSEPYFKLNVTIQCSNLLFIDIHLPGIWDAILCDVSCLGTSCLVLYYPEGKRGWPDQVHFFLSSHIPSSDMCTSSIDEQKTCNSCRFHFLQEALSNHLEIKHHFSLSLTIDLFSVHLSQIIMNSFKELPLCPWI